MASKHQLPNLKISIDNTDEASDSESGSSSTSDSEESSSSSSGSDSESDSESETKSVASVEVKVRLGDNTGNNDKRTGAFSRLGKRPVFSDNVKKYENKAGAFVTGIDLTSKDAQERKEDRGKRSVGLVF